MESKTTFFHSRYENGCPTQELQGLGWTGRVTWLFVREWDMDYIDYIIHMKEVEDPLGTVEIIIVVRVRLDMAR